jgi:hypothetical protein
MSVTTQYYAYIWQIHAGGTDDAPTVLKYVYFGKSASEREKNMELQWDIISLIFLHNDAYYSNRRVPYTNIFPPTSVQP